MVKKKKPRSKATPTKAVVKRPGSKPTEVPDKATTSAITRIEALLKNIQKRRVREITDADLKWVTKLSPRQISEIHHFYKRTFKDITLAAKGNDPYIVESYSHFTSSALRLALALLSLVFGQKVTKATQGAKTKSSQIVSQTALDL